MIKFIDIHGHCVQEHYVPYPPGKSGTVRHQISNPDEMLEFYDYHGVEKGVILPLCNAENTMQSQSNEEVLNIAKMHPGRFIPFCNIDPRFLSNSPYAPLGDMAKYYRDLGCKGVGEVTANLRILDPLVQNLFKGVEESGLPLTFHLSPYVGHDYGLVDDAGLPGLELSLQRFPNLKFFGHSQTFWAEIGPIKSREERFGYPKGPIEEEGAIVRLMRKYPNLYGDLSAGSGFNAVSRDRKFGIQFMTEFQDRLMFGTDICQPTMPTLRPLANYLKELRASGEISEAVFQKIARENAIRLLKL